jgi:hypothetical protein
VNFGARCIGTEAKETRPADSTSDIEEEKPTCRHAVGARKQSRKHSQHCDETPKEHDSVPIPEKKISTDQQAILIEADAPTVSAKKGQTELTPDHLSHTIPDNRAGCSCEYNDDDVDLTSGGGKECRGNKDCLPWERHAGTLQRDNTKDGPWAVDWDQLNQSIGQRNKLDMLTVFHSASPDGEMFASD